MSKELSKRKKIREAHRSSVRRIIASVNEILKKPEEIYETTTILLQQKLTLKEKLDILRESNDGILALVRDDEIEEEIRQADILHEEATRTIVQIEAALKQAQPFQQQSPSPPVGTLSPNMSDAGSIGGEGPSVKAKVRLPKLNLKKFNGNVTEWTAFWDAYKSAIHDNPELTDIDRFNYLNTLLCQSAAEAIAGLKLTSANYGEAISILDKRFGDKQRIINSHMDALVNLPPVNDLHDLKGIRQFYDRVESNVRGLKSLDIPSTSYGNLMVSILMNKLPQDLRLIITRKIKDDQWDLDNLLSIIQGEVQARERAHVKKPDPPTQLPRRPSNPPNLSTQSSLLSNNQRFSGPTCTYCRQSHPSVNCTVVTSVSARKELLRKGGRCYICLRKNHVSRDCASTTRCFKCGKMHHPSICHSQETKGLSTITPLVHPPTLKEQNEGSVPPLEQQSKSSIANKSTTMYIDTTTSILLQTARAKAWKADEPAATMNVRIILDSGSQRSYVTSRVRDTLNLPSIGSESLIIKTFGSTKEILQTCDIVQVSIANEQNEIVTLKAYSVPTICSPISNQATQSVQESCEHLQGLNLANCSDDGQDYEVDILIGSDQYWSIVTGEVVRGTCGPTAIGTKLGFVLSGPVQGLDKSSANLTCTHVLKCSTVPVREETSVADQELKRFWELEGLGIGPDERSVYEEFTDTIKFKEGRYEVNLPWKQPRPLLPDNYEASLQRFHALFRRLRRNPELLREYDDVIQDQIKRGIVQQVNQTAIGEVGRVHYLPHHPVIRRDKKTTKLRIVYDASAKSTGPSLNNCLYTGPSLSQSILDILLRFRSHRIALVGDIEKAFLMISISPEDRDALRFFWVDNITEDKPRIIVLRFTRVVFGVSSSPFLLNATIGYHIRNYEAADPQFVRNFMQSMYVDDLSAGEDTEKDAYEFYVKSKLRLAEGGFNLRKFVSNSDQLMRKIEENESRITTNKSSLPTENSRDLIHSMPPEKNSITIEDDSYTKSTIGNTEEKMEPQEHKVLGLKWNHKEDSLIFNFESVVEAANTCKPTKRNVVSASSRIFDPLGILSPITIQLKMLFQEICKRKTDWDGELDQDLRKLWQKLVSEMERISCFVVPRCYFDGIKERVLSSNLEGFCDASIRAYAAVVYLKVTTTNGCYAKIVASKARVSPITQRQTIPRLELLSALILARLIANVQCALESTLQLDHPACWTDSKVTLYWIRNGKREWKQFVQNRVNEIRSLIPLECWRHCPGESNPADIPSRGISPSELSDYKPWFSGPEWLTQLNDLKEPVDDHLPNECLEELKRECSTKIVNTTIAALVHDDRKVNLQSIIDPSRFSNYQRLLRVTATVFMAVEILKFKISKQESRPSFTMNARNVHEAETLWLKAMQADLHCSPKFESWKEQFGLFNDDDGLLRCGGRITKANIEDGTKYPILLNAKHPLTEMIVRNCHRRVGHAGVKETLTEMRAKHWLFRGRQFVRKILHKCVLCRKVEGRAYQAPHSPPLPDFRVQRNPPFAFVGVDFAGPLHIKPAVHEEATIKTWISLYTCCSTRAVHLDLVPNLSSEAFIRNFRRFVARRGAPTKVISDNAKTFSSSAKQLSALFEIPEVTGHLSNQGIEWSFNLQKAPWWGGFFERLVASVKRCLKKILGNARLTYEELLTAVVEVEAVLNSRPLTYVSTEELEEPLTPSHLMIGRRLLSLPSPVSQEVDPEWNASKQDLTRRMNHLNNLLDKFWNRWKNEYLLELRQSQRQGGKNRELRRIALGDIILVHEDNRRRCHWRMGKVRQLIVGEDGKVRGAKVNVSSKGMKPTTLRRPVQKLYPLEVNCSNNEEIREDKSSVEGTMFKPERPKRASSVVADRKRRQWIADGLLTD